MTDATNTAPAVDESILALPRPKPICDLMRDLGHTCVVAQWGGEKKTSIGMEFDNGCIVRLTARDNTFQSSDRKSIKTFIIFDSFLKSLREHESAVTVIHPEVIHERVGARGKAMNVAGWTLRADEHGRYRAFKKVSGKTRCLYVGRDPSRAAEKIAVWNARHQAVEGAR